MRHSPRKSVRRRQTVLMEAVEKRTLFNTSAWPLLAGSLRQDWSNAGLITANNNWGSVPSIVGYNPDRAGTTTNINPTTLLDQPDNTEIVLANQSSVSISNGTVAEFDGIANPTIAMQGSGGADSPNIVITLNTTGITAASSGYSLGIPVQYNVRDIDSTSDNAPQQVALQYRIGDTGNFTNLSTVVDATNAYISDATTGPSIATLVTAVDARLPADAFDKAKVQIRIMTTNAAGSDEWVGIDDIVVGSGPEPAQFGFEAGAYQVDEAAGTVTVKVTRGGDLTGTPSVELSTANGTATAPGDYTAISNQVLSFAANELSKDVQITIVNDSVEETLETFSATLANAVGGIVSQPSTTVSIVDNDSMGSPTGLFLNEINVNPTPAANSADVAGEYIEIKGNASGNLYNVYLVQFEGNPLTTPNSTGVADRVFGLGDVTMGSNGLLLVSADSLLPQDSNTRHVTSSLLGTGTDGLENDSQTWALVYSQTPLVATTDYDPENDGTLALPAGAQVLDSVAWADPTVGGSVLYSTAVLSQPSGTIGAATRFRGTSTANTETDWYNGEMAGASTADLNYSATNVSINTPSGAVLTPGATNYPANDQGVLYFSQASYAVNEAAGTATITIKRSGGASGTVTVNYATSSLSATPGSDYTETSGTLTFVNNDVEESFVVPIINDTDPELPESIQITLSSVGGGATLAVKNTTVLSIDDNDTVVPSGILLNEVNINPPGDGSATPGQQDAPFEFFELRGPANQSFNNVYIVSVEGDDTGAGLADLVIDLSGVSFGSNGLLLVKGSTGGFSPLEGGTSVYTTGFLDTPAGGALENGSNSFLVIFSTGGVIVGTDLDTNNDGTLDLPVGMSLLDGAGVKDGGASDKAYGALVQDVVASAPVDSFSRFSNNNTPLVSAAFYGGDLVGTDNTSVAFSTNTNNLTANFPLGGALTPGGANLSGGDASPPTVSSVVYDQNTSGQAPSITVTFSEAVQATTLDDTANSSFTLIDRSTNLAIPASNFTLSNVSTTVAKITFNGANGAPANGDFKVTVNAGNVKDVANNALAASTSQNYSFLQGDATNSRKVDTQDFNLLAGNFGSGGKSFSDGDFSFNGTVDSTDFDIFVGVTVYGSSLPAVPPPAPLAGAGALFGATRIDQAGDWAKILV